MFLSVFSLVDLYLHSLSTKSEWRW